MLRPHTDNAAIFTLVANAIEQAASHLKTDGSGPSEFNFFLR